MHTVYAVVGDVEGSNERPGAVEVLGLYESELSANAVRDVMKRNDVYPEYVDIRVEIREVSP